MRLAVTADDRTGAMEAAALCADAGLATVVVSWDGETATAECVVTDLRSRHLTPRRAAQRMAVATQNHSGGRRVHKIDSTLRGNWAAEIGVLLVEQRRVLVIPAYPAAGRTCVGGVVFVDGVPVAETAFGRDPTAPATSSRPAEALAAVEAATIGDVDNWLTPVCPPAAPAVAALVPPAVAALVPPAVAALVPPAVAALVPPAVGAAVGAAVAIADAATDERIDQLVSAVGERTDVVIAGPAAVVGAVARYMSTAARHCPPLLPGGPVLVVCGSLHPTSRAQAAAVRGGSGVTVIVAPTDVGIDREVIALELAYRAHEHLATHPTELVILLGGDTADAFIGDRSVIVHGSVGVGMALGTVTIDGHSLMIITKPGGFGTTNALVTLLGTRREGQDA